MLSKNMTENQFVSTQEAAKLLGISRIAVFNKIKKGEILATKVGRNYIIDKKDLGIGPKTKLTPQEKKILDKAINKTFKEYGKTLKLLSDT